MASRKTIAVLRQKIAATKAADEAAATAAAAPLAVSAGDISYEDTDAE